MSLKEAFEELAATGSSPLLLGQCKCEWAGTEIYGEEAISEAFRAVPLGGHEDTLFLQSAQHAALIASGSALFADLYDGRIGRLWRLGPGEVPAREPAVSVAFDPDLRQPRGGVYARLEDHSMVEPAHFRMIETAAARLIDAAADARQHRARAFVLRAFSDGKCAAALLAVHRLSGGDVRSSGFSFEAIVVVDGVPRTVKDQPIISSWTPRL